jgi:hypothetical protein
VALAHAKSALNQNWAVLNRDNWWQGIFSPKQTQYRLEYPQLNSDNAFRY